MTKVPHLSFPPRTRSLPNGDVVFREVEQDSGEHVAERAELAIRTEQGYRIEDPRFGVPHDVLRSPGADVRAFREALAASEPAASLVVRRITEADQMDTDVIRTLILEDS